jgi:hypothetical protein
MSNTGRIPIDNNTVIRKNLPNFMGMNIRKAVLRLLAYRAGEMHSERKEEPAVPVSTSM